MGKDRCSEFKLPGGRVDRPNQESQVINLLFLFSYLDQFTRDTSHIDYCELSLGATIHKRESKNGKNI